MADGKQQQSSAESQTSRSSTDIRAKEELLRKAKEKLSKVDVGSDGKENSHDGQYRTEALKFIEKDCLGMPNDRFGALIEKIADILKRKDLEKQTLVVEFSKARAEILNTPKNPTLRSQTSENAADTFPTDAESLLKMSAELGKSGSSIYAKAWASPSFATSLYLQ